MSNERGGIVRFFLVLLVLGGAGLFLSKTWWRRHNLQVLSGQIETAVNRRLTAAGLSDKQVLSELRKERVWGPVVWIESERRIALPAATALSELSGHLRATARQFYCQYSSSSRGHEREILIKIGPVVFQRLYFVTEPVPGIMTKLPVAYGSLTEPSVAFVIDDVAYDLDTMNRYAALGVPLTFAILPRDRHSKSLAEKAHQLHFPVILHLPMEPIDLAHNDPGGAALYLKMTAEQLHTQFEKDVSSVPEIVGINNHMGSAFTEDESKMDLVMRWVKQRNLFFLDSHTSVHSIVPRAAKRAGVPCLVNETFLDNSDDVTEIEHQLDQVLKLALSRKRTIAIGHYRRKHLAEALALKIPEFKAHGVTIVGLPAFFVNPNH